MTPTLLVVLPITIVSLATTHGAAFTTPSPILRAAPTVRPFALSAVKTTSDASTASRLKRIKAFTEWAKESGIK
jgi:hypothetical protein